MNPKAEYLIDLIFKKLKNYKAKEIFLEKENFKEFISSLLKEEWIPLKYNQPRYSKNRYVDITMYDISSLTLILIITFILSLFFLYKVTSKGDN